MIGVVVIGRNEGQRLVRCLKSLEGTNAQIVYVDSQSTDGSQAFARGKGVSVVELDMSLPFTAARARNAGLDLLRLEAKNLKYVQFVDGDCELEAGWIEKARSFLDANQHVAVVCGRRRERFADASIYNRLCDMEWDTPVGEALACGGDALFRLQSLVEAGGYDAALVAGEEPEICARLRTAGWNVWRLDAPMTVHDAAMMRFRQWWARSKRAGFAYAQVLHVQRRTSAEYPFSGPLRRALLWAFVLPATSVILLMAVNSFAAAVILMLYPLNVLRLRNALRDSVGPRGLAAGLMVLTKFAEASGMIKYCWQAILGRQHNAILYK